MAAGNRTRLFLNTLEVLNDATRDLIAEVNCEVETGQVKTPDDFSNMWVRFDDALELIVRARNEYCAETGWDYLQAEFAWIAPPVSGADEEASA